MPVHLAAQQRPFEQAWKRFLSDSSLRYASIAFEVMDASTGKIWFSHQSNIGLAPASCNKIFTAAAVLQLLGPDFRYATRLGYAGKRSGDTLWGDIYLMGTGDPSTGSWRYSSTTTTVIWSQWIDDLRKAGIQHIMGRVIGVDTMFSTQTIPGGWSWEDIGNYYGAGCAALNWHENQFDVYLQPGKRVNDSARLMHMDRPWPLQQVVNELTTGEPGSGDQAYVFYDLTRPIVYLCGTVPVDAEKDFHISASVPHPVRYAAQQFQDSLLQAGFGGLQFPAAEVHIASQLPSDMHIISLHVSPPMDSLVYWFLHRSINLYGEAFTFKMGSLIAKPATTEAGVAMIHRVCAQMGIDTLSVNTVDGSGLSPSNRVTAHALAMMLYRIQHMPWFTAFEQALPVIHGIRMKDGYIAGVRSYAGYIQDRTRRKLIFAFIVNNFTGSSIHVRQAMWQVLDALQETQVAGIK
ncbi:MAG: D-alanyl-D-alanine carboxypeptidase/D-alanyl-D-alanine-endopeptidase [Thermoflavifilum sp.]|nr:D-alanyl-D-alanine carboxypeptidase/D-alanyl-D-alanine-endopeptidase [Thermoflavifilum sp.]